MIHHIVNKRKRIATGTGGVSYTVGVAALPTLRFATPTLCFALPTFGGFDDFLALKQWFFTLAIQICHICRHFDIQFFVLQQNIQSMSHFAPPTFSEKLHPWLQVVTLIPSTGQTSVTMFPPGKAENLCEINTYSKAFFFHAITESGAALAPVLRRTQRLQRRITGKPRQPDERLHAWLGE